MQKADWTLLAVRLAGNTGLSPVQLQKSLFLLGQNLPDAVGEQYYSFTPYNYGPFDASIYQDAERLQEEGLVSIGRSPNGRRKIYSITDKGLKEAEARRADLDEKGVRYLEEVVDWVHGLSFQQLIRAIYRKYPEFRQNSVFQY